MADLLQGLNGQRTPGSATPASPSLYREHSINPQVLSTSNGHMNSSYIAAPSSAPSNAEHSFDLQMLPTSVSQTSNQPSYPGQAPQLTTAGVQYSQVTNPGNNMPSFSSGQELYPTQEHFDMQNPFDFPYIQQYHPHLQDTSLPQDQTPGPMQQNPLSAPQLNTFAQLGLGQTTAQMQQYYNMQRQGHLIPLGNQQIYHAQRQWPTVQPEIQQLHNLHRQGSFVQSGNQQLHSAQHKEPSALPRAQRNLAQTQYITKSADPSLQSDQPTYLSAQQPQKRSGAGVERAVTSNHQVQASVARQPQRQEITPTGPFNNHTQVPQATPQPHYGLAENLPLSRYPSQPFSAENPPPESNLASNPAKKVRRGNSATDSSHQKMPPQARGTSKPARKTGQSHPVSKRPGQVPPSLQRTVSSNDLRATKIPSGSNTVYGVQSMLSQRKTAVPNSAPPDSRFTPNNPYIHQQPPSWDWFSTEMAQGNTAYALNKYNYTFEYPILPDTPLIQGSTPSTATPVAQNPGLLPHNHGLAYNGYQGNFERLFSSNVSMMPNFASDFGASDPGNGTLVSGSPARGNGDPASKPVPQHPHKNGTRANNKLKASVVKPRQSTPATPLLVKDPTTVDCFFDYGSDSPPTIKDESDYTHGKDAIPNASGMLAHKQEASVKSKPNSTPGKLPHTAPINTFTLTPATQEPPSTSHSAALPTDTQDEVFLRAALLDHNSSPEEEEPAQTLGMFEATRDEAEAALNDLFTAPGYVPAEGYESMLQYSLFEY